MIDSAFESWRSILSDSKKYFFIITHPEELHALKRISSTHISGYFGQQWGQQMLAKCYPTSQGCSCDFPRLKVWPLGVPKPYRTSSYDVSSLLTRSTLFVFVLDSTNFPQNPRNDTKCWSRQEAMRHRMKMFDTALERPKVILLVLKSRRNITVMLGSFWSTSGIFFIVS